MEEKIFNCKMGLGKIAFTLSEDKLKIKAPLGSPLEIHKNQITKIDFKTVSNPVPLMGYTFNLYIFYSKNGKITKKTFIFSFDDNEANELVKNLKIYYPHADYLGPNENEKNEILQTYYNGKYRLHSMWFLVWNIIFFLLFGIMASIFLFADISKDGSQTIPAVIFTLIFLIPAILIILLIAGKVYIVKTNRDGFVCKKLIKNVFCKWDDFNIGDVKFKEQIIRGEFSTSTDSFFLIPIKITNRFKPMMLKMTGYTTCNFFAELYYREKVSLEKAISVGAFF